MGALEDMENAAAETPTPDDGTVGSVSDGLEIKELEVAGVITDRYGHVWQVPADNVDDLDDLYAGEPYKVPPELSDVFHVQLIPLKRLKEYQARNFVPVTLEEMAIPDELLKDGTPLDRFHVVGDSILVKIPKIIKDRIDAKKIKEVKERLKEVEPTKEMIQRAQQSGFMTRIEKSTRVDQVDPSKREHLIVKQNP